MKFRCAIVAVLCLFIIATPAICQEKYLFFGVGADGQSEPRLLGMGGFGIPLSETTLWYTDYDVSVVDGTTLKTILQPDALQFSTRTGIAQRVVQIDVAGRKLSILGLVAAGVGAGPGVPEDERALVPETVTKASFAYGGMIDIPLGKGWGIVAILQQEKNVAPDGFRFIPRVAVRYAFQGSR